MPELPADFDLKLMPDWLKEPPSKNPYADYQGGDDDRRSRGRDDWGRERGGNDRRGGKPGGGGGQRPGGGTQRAGGGPRRDDRGRKEGFDGRKPDGKPPGGPSGPGAPSRPEERRGKPGETRRTPDRNAPDTREPRTAPVPAANVAIEFFPDDSCAVSIGRQVKSTHRAYSLFDLARMFLARPERHRLKIATKTVADPIYQVGENGPVFLDKTAAERAAFPIARENFYVEVTERRDPPKGNFSNVARCRLNGALLGPTNYHGYQPALRKLYDERFSRRMSFSDFQRDIEVVSDPALVEQWKQQASSVTVYRLKPPTAPEPPASPEPPQPSAEATPAEPEKPAEAAAPDATEASAAPAEEPAPAPEASAPEAAAPSEPEPEPAPAAEPADQGPVFNSQGEVEHHFRENFLPRLIREGSSFHLTGEASRTLTDRAIASAVRQAWEQERGFPGQMMHHLRQQFSRAGLHIFKHRKRMQFVSLIRPSPMEDGSLSPSVAEILQFIQANQNCNRATLATAILGADEAAIDATRKTTLATDLRWLIETGRVIEFSDGRLELPVVPVKPETPAKPTAEAAPATTPAEAPSEAAATPAPEPAAPEALESAPNPAASAAAEAEPLVATDPAPDEAAPVTQSV